MKTKIIRSLCLIASLVFTLTPLNSVNAITDSSTPATASKVIIDEVKLGGDGEVNINGTKTKEYIVLYNLTDSGVDLTDWKIEYAKEGYNSNNCNAGNWSNFSLGYSRTIGGELAGNSLSLPINYGLNDSGSGSLRIIDDTDQVHDLVSWKDKNDPPCVDGAPTLKPAVGKTIQRYIDCQGLSVDTDDNVKDFANNQELSPASLSGITDPRLTCDDTSGDDEVPPDNTPGMGGQTGDSRANCKGVIINEILPNPAGSDSGKEFIELYNPSNKQVALSGCFLELSTNNKKFIFSDELIEPNGFLVINATDSGLVLPNTSGASLWLVDSDNNEFQVSYPGGLEDDTAWAFSDGKWQKTHQATPGEENIILVSKPCPSGQIRNPVSNRCASIVSSINVLTPCAPGKERNPATNRCRNVVSKVGSLKSCAPDQVRNPETNRCRKINSTSSLKPCAPGQERNIQTNRCRKVLGATTANGSNFDKVKDVPAKNISRSVGWWLVGVSILGIIGYGLFEWRKELVSAYTDIKSKISP